MDAPSRSLAGRSAESPVEGPTDGPIATPAAGPAAGVTTRTADRALAARRSKYVDEVERLVAGAFAAMRDGDTIDPTVGAILRRAQLSTTAFYRHFATKDDLLLALLEHATATTASYIAHVVDAAAAPADRVAAWIRGMFDLIRSDVLVAANRPVLLAHARLVERFPDDIARNTAALAAPLADAISDARTAAGGPAGDPAADARLTHRLVYGVISDRAAERRTADPAEVEAVVSYAQRALLG